ncbi:MAG TPA: PspC domain-containing protein [Moheibacter sp.]|nr:PspC domain-containing protein [Moheibacter sp.]
MDKTIAISLGGFSFTIDEIAYRKLKTYLDEIRQSLNNMEGSDEIMSDVEIRIAELFKERLSNREVVNESDIDAVMLVMGRPEQYMDEENDSSNESSVFTTEKTKKKLFRDVDEKVLGGVLSGLAHYLGIETWITRVVFIVLVFADIPLTGTSFTVVSYLILWIILPKAQTTAQKYEMHGRAANFENIKKNVSNATSELKGATSNVSSTLGEILRIFARILLAIFGFVFLCIGLSLLIGAISILFTYNMIPLRFFGYVIDYSWQSWSAKAMIFILLTIPALLFSLVGARLISTRVKIRKTLIISAVAVWIATLIGGSILALSLAKNYMNEVEFSEKNAYTLLNDTLTISIKDYYEVGNKKLKMLNELDGYMEFDGQLHRKNNKKVEVLKSNDDQLWVEVVYFSKGGSYDQARENAELIDFKYQMNANGELLLDEYILLGKDAKIRDQSVSVRLYVPENKSIYFKDIQKAKFMDKNSSYSSYESVKNRLYQWENDEFECQNCWEDNEGKKDKKNKEAKVKISKDGIHIEGGTGKVIINENKIEISDDTDSIDHANTDH